MYSVVDTWSHVRSSSVVVTAFLFRTELSKDPHLKSWKSLLLLRELPEIRLELVDSLHDSHVQNRGKRRPLWPYEFWQIPMRDCRGMQFALTEAFRSAYGGCPPLRKVKAVDYPLSCVRDSSLVSSVTKMIYNLIPYDKRIEPTFPTILATTIRFLKDRS